MPPAYRRAEYASVTDLISLFRVRFGERLRVVFFETHDLCTARYDGGWSAELDLLGSDAAQFVRHCRDSHTPFADVKDALLIESGRVNLTELCLKATFTPAGTRLCIGLRATPSQSACAGLPKTDDTTFRSCMSRWRACLTLRWNRHRVRL